MRLVSDLLLQARAPLDCDSKRRPCTVNIPGACCSDVTAFHSFNYEVYVMICIYRQSLLLNSTLNRPGEPLLDDIMMIGF